MFKIFVVASKRLARPTFQVHSEQHLKEKDSVSYSDQYGLFLATHYVI